MKREEKIAEKYFKSIGFENIEFEPKGNRTPDFSIDEKIAIEVRRLNQFHNGRPLEKVSYNLIPKIINQVESFGDNSHINSAFIGIRYSRPIKYNQKIKERIDSILKSHSSKMEVHKVYTISENLEINIFPSDKRFDIQYHFGSSADFNEGGFVLTNIYNSLKLIIKEKTHKTQPFRSEYDTWWLALIDNIGSGLSKSELLQLKESIDFELYFDKVFIISNMDPITGGEI